MTILNRLRCMAYWKRFCATTLPATIVTGSVVSAIGIWLNWPLWVLLPVCFLAGAAIAHVWGLVLDRNEGGGNNED